MAKLNKTPLTIRAKRGTESQITSYTGYQLSGEFAYATDTNNLYVSNGTTFLAVAGATPTLQSVTDEGNTTTNSITAQSFIVEGIQNYDMTLRSEENTGVVIESPRGIFINTSRSTYFNTDTDGGSWGDRQWIFGSSRQYSTGGRTYFKIGNLSGYPFLSLNNHDNNEQVRFDSNGNSYINGGNVGIGTTAPQQKLHVGGVLMAQNIGGSFERSIGLFPGNYEQTLKYSGTGLVIQNSSNDNDLGAGGGNVVVKLSPYATNDRTTTLSLGNKNQQSLVHTSANGLLTINNATSGDVMAFDLNSNVGIGTTAPAAKLHIATSTSGGEASAIIQDDVRAGTGTLNYIGLTDSTGTTQAKIGYLSALNGDLSFSNFIGNTTISSTGQVVLNASSNILLNTGGSASVKIDNTGNVGIGTTAPALQSGGTGLHINAPTSSEIKFTNSTTGTTASDGTALVSNGVGFTINNRESGSLTLGTNNSARLYIDSAGNVGIGTTAPSTLLHLRGDSPTLRIEADGANESSIIELVQDGGVTGAAIKYNGASNIEALQFNTGVSDTRMTIKRATGNVGIGTTAPGARLDIQSPAGGQSTLLKIKSTNSSAEPMLQFDNNANTLGKIGGVNGGGLRFTTLNNVEALRITLSGDVGIGTTAPAHVLHINKDNPYIQIQDSSAPTRADMSAGIIMKDSTGAQSFGITQSNSVDVSIRANAGDLSLGTFSGTVIKLDGNNVGIGTTAPSEKLEVVGAIRAEDVKINTGSRFFRFTANNISILSSNELSVTSNATNVVVGRLGLGSTYSSIDIGAHNKTYQGYLSAIWATTGKDALRIYTPTPSQGLTITENAYLGIETTAPQSKLTIGAQAGTIATLADFRGASDNDFIQVSRTTDTARGVKIFSSGRINASSTHTSEAAYLFNNASVNTTTTGDREFFQINGDWSPSSGTSTWAQTLLSPTINTTGTYVGTVRGIYYNPTVTSATGATHRAIETTAGDVIFSNGNVGIGTTSPTSTLHVSGTARIHSAANGAFGTLTLGSINDIVGDVSNINFNNNGSSWMRILNGNVGIGTTAPDSKLHVKATSGIAFKVDPNSADKEWYIDTTNPDHLKKEGNLILNADPTNVHTSTKISFNIDGSNKASINSDGDLGVGTTAQTSKVHVNGTAMRQLRIGTAGGPSSNTDTSGAEGDIAYDDLYLYIKTGGGWGRVALDFGF